MKGDVEYEGIQACRSSTLHCTNKVLASGMELRSQPYSLSPPISYRIAESFDDMLFAARP